MENKIAHAIKLYNEEKFEESFKALLPIAERGDPEAQSYVGLMFSLGQGVNRNIELAIKWLTEAANQDRGDAAHNLGTLYLTCEPDFPTNREIAVKWYKTAKSLGFVVTQDSWYDQL